MKKLNKYKSLALTLVITAIALQGCIDEAPDIGEPFDRVNSLSGTWQLISVVQNDEIAISRGFPAFVQSVDLTERIGFTDYELTLSINEEGNPTNYTENRGTSPAILAIPTGSWSVDEPSAPSTITFSGEGGITVLEIGTYVGLLEGLLTLKLTKTQDGNPVLSYEYNFQKSAN